MSNLDSAAKVEPNAPIWVKILVYLHVVAVAIWVIPKPAQAVMNGVTPPRGTEIVQAAAQHLRSDPSLYRDYMSGTGLWQVWDMFAPNPSNLDVWADAVVEYRDGTTKVYQYPRMYELSIPVKYVSERYRKFYERANQDENKYLWPFMAQRIAQLNWTNPENPPVKVKLRRHFRLIQPPDQVTPETYQEAEFYVHTVDQTKLQEGLKG